MKWFLLLFVLMGSYAALMLSTASQAIDRTAKLYQSYETIAEQTASLDQHTNQR